MGFFDEMRSPPPAQQPEEHRPREWMAAPENVVDHFADLGVLLVRGPEVAIAAGGFVAYTTGVEFQMTVRGRRRAMRWPLFGDGLPRSSNGDDTSHLLRAGIQFSDGAKATTEVPSFDSADDGTPDGPVLRLGGGGGGGRSWHVTFWLWPLPPEGPLALVVEGPSQAVPETRLELSADPLRAAAVYATVLWPDDRPRTTTRATLVSSSDQWQLLSLVSTRTW